MSNLAPEQLFPFQEVGADWLRGKRHALLADEMGLGKSVQAIRAADHLGLKKVLVVCPAIARINWLREFHKWGKVQRDFYIPFRLDDPVPNSSLICSHEWALHNAERLAKKWEVAMLDEVQFMKSVGAKRSQAILGAGSLAHHSERVWALSGTPAPNHAGELWILLKTFGITNLCYSNFLARYCDQANTPYGWKVVGTKRAMIPELKELLSHIMLRRKVGEVLPDLPSIFYSDVVVEPGFVRMTPEMKEQTRIESALLGDTLEEMSRVDNQTAMRLLEAVAQSISTLLRYSGLQKVEPAADLIKTEMGLGLYSKIIIFAIHKDVVRNLAMHFPGAVTVTGDTSPSERQEAVDAFQRDPKCSHFIGNIRAAGTAITLTSAHQELFVERSFTPGDNAQAAKRAHRIGQLRNVNARFLTLNNPMDEKVTKIVRKKTHELTLLLG
jgi:SWI/SNF-related matrix-associated actin-dependent regulator 1 of chromatin subfamily A